MSASSSVATQAARNFLSYVNQTGSPYHSVSVVKELLKAANFRELKEKDVPWNLQRGGKYFLTKHGSTICAFVVGGKFTTQNGGFVVCGAHTDSPCLRLRPNTKIGGDKNHVQVGIQTYGGGLWHTWFDRPLGLAGKVLCKSGDIGLEERLLRISEPVLLIPNLAIHLQSADERKAFAPSTETSLQPILCMKPPSSTDINAGDASAKKDDTSKKAKEDSTCDKMPHSEELLALIADHLKVKKDDISDLDLCLFDVEPSRLIGLNEDFIYSARIDNLVSVFAQYDALIQFAKNTDNSVDNCSDIAVAVAFDHEEVGSESTVGADSGNMEAWLKQILGEMLDNTKEDLIVGQETCIPMRNKWLKVLSHSIFFSIDGAHGFHPNYTAKHQTEHRPILHQGIVVKSNANQRYSTTPLTGALFRRVCEKAGAKVQDFVVRNDSPCGSTIGPMVSSNLGMRAIDVGIPQWAMHSCKETCSSVDLDHLVKFCKTAFAHFRDIDTQCTKL